MTEIKLARGFTLVELLVVIAIIGLLSSVVYASLFAARDKARLASARLSLKSFANAIELYAADNGGVYPPDQSRGVPFGIEQYLPGGVLPEAAWPNSVYDWDSWINPNDGTPIYQVSIRFCPPGATELSECTFPASSWASGFSFDSSVYWCMQGACLSHISHINDSPAYPGFCANCPGS